MVNIAWSPDGGQSMLQRFLLYFFYILMLLPRDRWELLHQSFRGVVLGMLG